MADPELAAFAQSLEIAAVAAYQTLAPFLDDAAAWATLFAQHHQDHANAFAAFAGELARGTPNAAVVALLGPDLIAAKEEASALEFAFQLENQLVETYAWLLGQLTSPAVAQTVAAVLSVQSAHAGALGVALGKAIEDLYPTGPLVAAAVGDGADSAKGFDPALFPAG